LKRLILTFLTLFSFLTAFSQIEDAWVYFKDKPTAAVALANPTTILSQRSLDRRIRYNIALDTKDAPIEEVYKTAVSNILGITVLAKSKWLNALHVQGTKATIDNLSTLQIEGNFIIESIEYADKTLNVSGKTRIQNKSKIKKDKLKITTTYNYGNGANQIQMLKGEVLHQNNFTGQGMQIAILDAGFPNVDNFSAFQYIRDNNQILGGYNFVDRNTNYYTRNYHGMAVLSTIASNLDGQFVGSAPDADFYLFITEDANNEIPLEESLWVEAAEKADSLGVDIINSSLGYSSFFDNVNHNYSYQDMDGQTAFITRGAEIAFSRGMIVVNSAGNEGNDPWHYINAPADGASVLSIGAVDASGTIANFSSYGPTADNRIKPDVLAQGANVYIINSLGNIATSNGTSFSSPLLAGVVACLWQAFPTKTNAEITQLVKESAHLYATPNNHEGYGIPNFQTIFNLLDAEDSLANEITFKMFPNPVSEQLNFKFPTAVTLAKVSIVNSLGIQVYYGKISNSVPFINVSNLNSGLYFVQLNYNTKTSVYKFIKN